MLQAIDRQAYAWHRPHTGIYWHLQQPGIYLVQATDKHAFHNAAESRTFGTDHKQAGIHLAYTGRYRFGTDHR